MDGIQAKARGRQRLAVGLEDALQQEMAGQRQAGGDFVAMGLVATPLLIRLAAWRDRREIVTGWKELHHDAIGDSLAWSTR